MRGINQWNLVVTPFFPRDLHWFLFTKRNMLEWYFSLILHYKYDILFHSKAWTLRRICISREVSRNTSLLNRLFVECLCTSQNSSIGTSSSCGGRCEGGVWCKGHCGPKISEWHDAQIQDKRELMAKQGSKGKTYSCWQTLSESYSTYSVLNGIVLGKII